jgi:hypothetical protein
MGSDIDARKLVSSLTLFGETAQRVGDAEGDADLLALSRVADEILDLARRDGYERCPFTLRRVAVASSPPRREAP